MYDLPYYKEHDKAVIKKFIDENPFAFLSGCNEQNKPVATQIPVFIEDRNGKLFLSGHIMKNTDHHKAFESNPNVLAVFSGPHTYVSATWYDDPYTASTWNYMSVYANGSINFLDENSLINVLRKTSLHFENYNQQSTTAFDNLPREYTREMIKGIVAFEIEIIDMKNVFKLSQDRDKKSYENIIENLANQNEGAQGIACEMEKRRKELFD